WVAVFVIPLGALWFGQVWAPRTDLQRAAQIVADVPAGSTQHVSYGNALQDAGRIDEAGEEFSTALRFNPNSAKAHVGLAAVSIGKGRLEEARTHFEAALRVEPNNPEYHSGYAFVLERLGHAEEAAAESEAAVPSLRNRRKRDTTTVLFLRSRERSMKRLQSIDKR